MAIEIGVGNQGNKLAKSEWANTTINFKWNLWN